MIPGGAYGAFSHFKLDMSELTTLAVKLGEVPKEAAQKAKAVTIKTAYDIERTAKERAPVDTGNLRRSIGHSDLRISADSILVEIGPSANYGEYVEYGTSRMSPQPYLTPAFDTHTPVWERVLQQIVDDAL